MPSFIGDEPFHEPQGDAAQRLYDMIMEIRSGKTAANRTGFRPAFLRHEELRDRLREANTPANKVQAIRDWAGNNNVDLNGIVLPHDEKARRASGMTQQQAVANFLTQTGRQQTHFLGGVPSPDRADTHEQHKRAIQHAANALDELVGHLGSGAEVPGGLGWYQGAINTYRRRLQDVLAARPGTRLGDHAKLLTDPGPRRSLFEMMLGLTSNGLSPKDNLKAALQLYFHAAGRNNNSPFSTIVPTDAQLKARAAMHATSPLSAMHPGRMGTVLAGLNRLQGMVKSLGEQGTADFLHGTHTRNELALASGRSAKDIDPRAFQPVGVPNAHEQMFLGSDVFGPKISPYFGSISGTEPGLNRLVADRWQTKSVGRHWSDLIDYLHENWPVKSDPHKGERPISWHAYDMLGNILGLMTGQIQAPHWYYEQNLYNALGSRPQGGGDYTAGIRDAATTPTGSTGSWQNRVQGHGASVLNAVLGPHVEPFTPEEVNDLISASDLHHATSGGQYLQPEEVAARDAARKAAQHVIHRRHGDLIRLGARACGNLLQRLGRAVNMVEERLRNFRSAGDGTGRQG